MIIHPENTAYSKMDSSKKNAVRENLKSPEGELHKEKIDKETLKNPDGNH